jgi:sulfate/thiosulfate transport system permease protein
MTVDRPWRIGLRTVALGYLALLLFIPIGIVFYRTFEHGVGAVWDAVTTPAAISAFWLTITVTAIAVPLNTIFGIPARSHWPAGASAARCCSTR